MAASSAAGWRSSSASWGSSSAGISAPPSGANADLKVHKGRIPGFRRARNRNGLWSIVLIDAHPAVPDRADPRLGYRP